MTTLYIFANSFWNTGQGMTGGDKRILEILKRWDRDSSLPFTCVVFAPQKFIEMLRNEGICHMSFTITSTASSERKGIISSYIIHTFKALKLLPYFKRDCRFYSTSDFFTDTIPCAMGKLFNRKAEWISLIHHIIETYRTRPGKKLTNFISYYAQRLSLLLIRLFSDKILLVSPLVREYLIRKKCKKKMTLVNNGVDAAYISKLPPYAESDRKYDAVMLARLAPSKGIFDLPKIWAAVCSQRSGARLALIGGGSDEIVSELKKMFSDEGITSNVDILGHLDNESVYRSLKSAKIFLFTSREEGWGISIAEAMACGLPVVAFELPVYKYVFPVGGVWIPDRSIPQMSETLQRFLQDDCLRQKYAEQGSAYVLDKYDWAVIAEQEKNELYNIQ